MRKFFSKKKVIIMIVAAIITVMVAVFVGVKISNNKMEKEKSARKAQVQKIAEERKEAIDKINDSKLEKEKTEEDNYTEEYKEYEKLPDEEKEKLEVIPRKEKVDYSELENIKEDQKEDLGEEYVNEDDGILPKKFNLKDKISIKVENQGQFGLCWDFASVKALETNLQLTQNKDYDISESHIDYMTSNLLSSMNRKENCGGHFSYMIKYNDFYKGFVTEDVVPLNVYEDYEYNTFYNMPKEDIYITKYVNFPALYKDEEMSDEDYEIKKNDFQNVVKTHVMNYGSLYAVIDAPDYGYNHYIKNYEDVKNNTRGCHAVSIVGWDDNYSRDNFTSPNGNKPQKDGAYIALNSWGEYWGQGGYFYISYEDRMVHKELTGIVSVNNKYDLIKLSRLSDVAHKYIVENNYDMIVNIDGEDYIREDLLESYSVDLSGMNIDNIDDIGILLSKAFSIDLSNNNLEDIDGIEKYIKLTNVCLNLSNNNIKDVSNLKNKSIDSLKLDGNYGVEGYELLDYCYFLSLEDCGITELPDMSNVNIGHLNLSNNVIDDYSNVCKLNELYALDLRNCELDSLDKLEDVFKMKSIGHIDLSHNNIKDISAMNGSSIQSVNLSYNSEISDFEPLRKASRLVSVHLVDCNIKDAQDILIESEVDEYLDEISEYEEFEMEEYCGVYYELSNNKELHNLKALKNAYSIIAEDCNLSDISELKELEYLRDFNVSNNDGIYGDLSGKGYYCISINNCGLDEDFNLFNIAQVDSLEIRKNNIKNIDKLKDKVTFLIRTDSYDGEINNDDLPMIQIDLGDNQKIEESIEIEIPDQKDLKMNVTKYMESKYGYNYTVDGKKYTSYIMIVPINENTVITYETFSPTDKKVTITFKVNKNLKSDGLMVVENPNVYKAGNIETIKAEDIKVANVYANCITGITKNYSINNNTYAINEKQVERDYYGDGRLSYIFVPKKFYCNVAQGGLTAKLAVGSKSVENFYEDLIQPEDFEEEFPE